MSGGLNRCSSGWLRTTWSYAVVGSFSTKPHTGTVIEPQSTLLRLFTRHLERVAPPQALDSLVVELQAGLAQQGHDMPEAVSAAVTWSTARQAGVCADLSARP
ncbi:MAG: hypothetical protein F4169_02935 [Gammaproteobacteria bacterium]|nr:hypothetical protein [Gammaproteobacteria bacterium]